MAGNNRQIELSIVSPAGSAGAAAVGGGGLGEWAHKYTTMGCVATFVSLLIGAALGMAVGGLVLVYGDNSDNTCIGDLEGISFSYVTWLRVMGFSFIGGLLVLLALVFAHGWWGTWCTSKLATVFGLLFFFFQMAWYVVGSILYWETVTTNCASGTEIQVFSLALFIIQTVVITCMYCGRKAAEASSA
jgi:hypothetical protein